MKRHEKKNPKDASKKRVNVFVEPNPEEECKEEKSNTAVKKRVTIFVEPEEESNDKKFKSVVKRRGSVFVSSNPEDEEDDEDDEEEEGFKTVANRRGSVYVRSIPDDEDDEDDDEEEVKPVETKQVSIFVEPNPEEKKIKGVMKKQVRIFVEPNQEKKEFKSVAKRRGSVFVRSSPEDEEDEEEEEGFKTVANRRGSVYVRSIPDEEDNDDDDELKAVGTKHVSLSIEQNPEEEEDEKINKAVDKKKRVSIFVKPKQKEHDDEGKFKAVAKKRVSIFVEPIPDEEGHEEGRKEVGGEETRTFKGQTNHELKKSLKERRASTYRVSKRTRTSTVIVKFKDTNRPVIDSLEDRRASMYVISTAPKWSLPRKSISASGRYLMRMPNYLKAISSKVIFRCLGVLMFILYNVFLSFVIIRNWRTQNDPDKATDSRFLIYLSLFIYAVCIYNQLLRKRVARPISYKVKRFIISVQDTDGYTITIRVIWCLAYGAIVAFLIIDTKGNRIRLVSASGILVILAFGYVFSKDRRKVTWRPVLWGVLMQYILGLISIRWNGGRIILEAGEKLISGLLEHSDYGTQAVYGYLVDGKLAPGLAVPQEAIFTYRDLMVMVFVSMWLSVLYHYGIMQKIIMKVGWVLEVTTGTTACESMAVAANMALAIPNSFLTIKPYLAVMTSSELHTVIASGLATIPGNFMGTYTHLGLHASDLMSAMLMSAAASLAFTKLFYPETETSRTNIWNLLVYKGEHRSALEAAVSGAMSGMEIMMKVCGSMIAFGSFIAFLDSVPKFLGTLVGFSDFSLKWLFSKLFLPVAYIMGVDPKHCEAVALMVGINLMFSNTSAFKILAADLVTGKFSGRTELIATYAICGLYTISSIGIVLGSLGTLIPERRSEISAVVVRGIISGAAICFMTACIAGSLLNDDRPQGLSDVQTLRQLNSFKMVGYWGDFISPIPSASI